jgi:hypothetical protein
MAARRKAKVAQEEPRSRKEAPARPTVAEWPSFRERLLKELRESERLTRKDLGVRINTRD